MESMGQGGAGGMPDFGDDEDGEGDEGEGDDEEHAAEGSEEKMPELETATDK